MRPHWEQNNPEHSLVMIPDTEGKDLEQEYARLRKAVSDLTLYKMILAEAAKGNC